MKAEDNLFPYITLVEGAAPSTPSAGRQKEFIDSADHKLKRVDSAGAVTIIEGGGAGGGGVTDWTYQPADHSYGDTAVETRTAGTYGYYPGTHDYTNYAGGGGINNGGAQNDALEFNIWVGPGTYTLQIVGNTDSTRGIQTWAIDDGAGTYTTLGTLDWYAAGSTFNVVKSLTGLVVGGSLARRKLRCKMATKNASASAYYMFIQRVSLLRTA